jgi:hypothetical protein
MTVAKNFFVQAQAAGQVNKNGDIYSLEALKAAFGNKANIQVQPNGDIFVTMSSEFIGEFPKPFSMSMEIKHEKR